MKTALVPTPGARWLRTEVDRLFDRIWDGDESPAVGEWIPRVDLSDSPESLTARVEVPGLDPKDIHITIENDMLTLKGEKREMSEEKKEERYLRVERAYGAFARSLRLPSHVDAAKASATFKNGLLVIVMPKAPEAKGTMVPIKVN